MGLENISVEGKRMMIFYEKKASEYALNILQDILNETTITHARGIYNKWLEGYCKKAKLEQDESLLL